MDKSAPPAQDLVVRDFAATAGDAKWCGDIAYIPVGSSWLFLATVIDICSRRVVGCFIADHMRTDLVMDAIELQCALAVVTYLARSFTATTDRGTPQWLSPWGSPESRTAWLELR
nr:hypothetical protein GCM10017611_04680 [Rhodococcus wratislaviensis]